jgi:hypothetical protein
MWTHTSGETSADRPKRIRLSDFTTRTSEAVTDELLADAGWTFVEPVPPTEPVVETPVVVVTEQVEMMVSGTM